MLARCVHIIHPFLDRCKHSSNTISLQSKYFRFTSILLIAILNFNHFDEPCAVCHVPCAIAERSTVQHIASLCMAFNQWNDKIANSETNVFSLCVFYTIIHMFWLCDASIFAINSRYINNHFAKFTSMTNDSIVW